MARLKCTECGQTYLLLANSKLFPGMICPQGHCGGILTALDDAEPVPRPLLRMKPSTDRLPSSEVKAPREAKTEPLAAVHEMDLPGELVSVWRHSWEGETLKNALIEVYREAAHLSKEEWQSLMRFVATSHFLHRHAPEIASAVKQNVGIPRQKDADIKKGIEDLAAWDGNYLAPKVRCGPNFQDTCRKDLVRGTKPIDEYLRDGWNLLTQRAKEAGGPVALGSYLAECAHGYDAKGYGRWTRQIEERPLAAHKGESRTIDPSKWFFYKDDSFTDTVQSDKLEAGKKYYFAPDPTKLFNENAFGGTIRAIGPKALTVQVG